MADILLASLLLIGGALWSFVCLMTYATHPTPGQANFGSVVYVGPAAFLAGAAWWAWIISGWLL